MPNADKETLKWLHFASDIDDAARFLIRTAIRAAAKDSADDMTPWAQLARDADLDRNIEYSVLEFLRKAYESGDETQERQASLRLSLARIDAFLKAGAELVDELREYVADENGDVPTAEGADADAQQAGDNGVDGVSVEQVDQRDESGGTKSQ